MSSDHLSSPDENSSGLVASPQTLTLNSHDANELKDRALASFDCSAEDWTPEQTAAADRLRLWCERPEVRADVRAISDSDIEELIGDIGRVFCCDGLQGMDFSWIDANEMSQHGGLQLIGVTSGYLQGKESIRINTSHDWWKNTPPESRWLLSMGVLLHEAIHAFFARYAATVVGHQEPWHLIAEAVERRACNELGLNIDLRRVQVLVNEWKLSGHCGLTELEL